MSDRVPEGPQVPGTAGVSDAEIAAWVRDGSACLRIAARLAREIRDGKYNDWKPLPPAGVLAGEYDVSRGTVNRAQRLLAGRGLIKREGNFFYAVEENRRPACGASQAEN